jgi:AraC-like DNA-binding protein
MKFEAHLPAVPLTPFIKGYLIIESQEEVVNKVLPGTSLAIAFRFRGQTNYINDQLKDALPVSTISGLRRSVRLINYLKDSSTIVILFKEGGATAFFKEPLHELFEESVSLDNLITASQTVEIEERLAQAKTNGQRVAIIDTFLMSKLSYPKSDNLILNAINQIQAANGIIKIKSLAENFFISHDAFEKRFRKIVGTSPKQFSNIVRMKSIITQKQLSQNFTDMAFGGGYFDQPHFNKDFKLFTGQTPTDFFKSPTFW